MKKYLTFALTFALLFSFTPRAYARSESPAFNIDVGDTVYFGRYEQDNDLSNGPEEIAWTVLNRSQDRALVISKYVLDCKAFNDEYTETDWGNCSLRKWINESFLNKAFDLDEQAYIYTQKVNPHRNPDYDTDAGKDTQDKVFLLSIQEINSYFPLDSGRSCIPTAYAADQGCRMYPGTNTGWWWTRTPGSDNYYATDVRGDGTVNTIGGEVNRLEIGVRPAMWISLFAFAKERNEALPAWKKAYADLIIRTPHIEEWSPDIRDDEDKLLLCAYSLYDIDKDGVPELFLHFGDGEAVECGRLYTFRDDNAILLTYLHSVHFTGAGDERQEEKSFPYGYNYFSTYPEGNGVWFAHERFGQAFKIWSIEDEYVMESEVKLSQEYAEVNSASVVFPGSCSLTEFPAYTLLPLMRYEEWSQLVAPAIREEEAVSNQELRYPADDPQFFEKVISGEIPVIPCLVPRLYGRWEREYYFYNLSQSEPHMYSEMEGRLIYSYGYELVNSPSLWPAPIERTVYYADLNGDGQLEAVCCAKYIKGGDREENVTFILSEQNGNVYAYGITKHVKNVDENGVLYFCDPPEYIKNLIYEGAFILSFDKEESFFVNILLENYVGIRCKPEEFETIDPELEIRYWQAMR